MSPTVSTRARVRDVLRELQERERQGPPCPQCGKPVIRIRLAVGSVVRRGRRYYAERHESAEDLGACQCPPVPEGPPGQFDIETIGLAGGGRETRKPADDGAETSAPPPAPTAAQPRPPRYESFSAGLCHRCGEPRNQPARHLPECPWHPAWLRGVAS